MKEALGVTDDVYRAEYDDLEEAKAKMDNLFETESDTSVKEADNYKCVFCKKMYIDNIELINHVENKESEEELFSNSNAVTVLKHMEVH